MTREEILHLATLARLGITESELAGFQTDLSAIMSYVSTVTDIAADTEGETQTVGARFNVFRPDEVTNGADQFTEALLAEMPATDGRYLKVKKILSTGS